MFNNSPGLLPEIWPSNISPDVKCPLRLENCHLKSITIVWFYTSAGRFKGLGTNQEKGWAQLTITPSAMCLEDLAPKGEVLPSVVIARDVYLSCGYWSEGQLHEWTNHGVSFRNMCSEGPAVYWMLCCHHFKFSKAVLTNDLHFHFTLSSVHCVSGPVA